METFGGTFYGAMGLYSDRMAVTFFTFTIEID